MFQNLAPSVREKITEYKLEGALTRKMRKQMAKKATQQMVATGTFWKKTDQLEDEAGFAGSSLA